ncbi:GGDEF domain-containing response regulator [Moorena sp. SIO3B2]|uniref:GGDEF domain-containing response regulator n=1 Tax=Moorena sp. SIO3B2 TaxID=2607827 RepID=UPI0013C616D5|nr:GGDEF domain-containing response regulator [Moorena sp. SIO3B2]NEP33877.1 GGDEF domain-containing response regulator [Moorena sp. SIO3B2]
MNKPLRILIVEDSEDDAELLVVELKNGGYEAIYERVEAPGAMNEALDNKGWDLVIADYFMPKFSAIGALLLLQKKGLDLPFIIVSGSIKENMAIAAMKAGAHDYLLKHQLARLVPAVERELREAKVRKNYRKAIKRLQDLTFYDELTGLPNRTLFLYYLRQWFKPVQPTHNRKCLPMAYPIIPTLCWDEPIVGNTQKDNVFAVLSLTLSRYGIIQYSLGDLLSEQLLVATAQRLQECIGDQDILARMGENKFAILLSNIQDLAQVKETAERIHQEISIPFDLNGRVVSSNCYIGIVLSTMGYEQPKDLLRGADTAMYYAKLEGKGASEVFHPSMQKRAIERLQLETDLQQAIKYETLHLNYQPIVSLTTGKTIGFEALARWQHRTRIKVSPSEFIPVAEETGLIIPLGEWILREACKQLSLWQDQFPDYSSLSISVNLSGIQLNQPQLIDQIDQICTTLELSGANLKLEITESVLVDNASVDSTILQKLKDRNIKLCIDDFGTGYSSFSYLNDLPIDIIKIARSFISQGFTKNGKNFDTVEAIVNLAKKLKIQVIAEGIETQEQKDILQDLGCEYGQGFLFGEALTAETVTNLMLTKPDRFW